MAKKDKNSLNLRSSVYGTPTINALELKAGANKLGEWFLLGLGAFGKLATAPFTLQGPTSSTIYKSKELLDKEQTIDLKSEELLGKAMSWISPLNYVTAIASGNGLNARKGEEVVSSWSPAMLALGRAGELYFGPKGVKGIKNTPKTIVNTAAKAGSKTAKKVVVARELSNGIKENAKSGRIEVSPEYFKAEDKWYRLSERPEKIGIEELGKNITTQDDPEIPGTIGNWRSTILDNRKGLNGKSKRIVPKPDNGFVLEEGMNFAKHGQAHGNTSQAAKGLIWDGTFAFSNRFPGGIIEGQAPNKIFRGMTAEGKDSRSNFVLLNWEDVPTGARIGFHTGEMPMSNLGWFQRTNKGTYTYEPIIPEKRIEIKPSTKLLRVVSEGTYPLYRGRLYFVKEIVNSNGTVNPRQAMKILHEVSEQFPGSYKMEHRLENPEWHQNDPTTYHHTKNVARSAWYIDPPLGFTKQDLMIAALGHDFGKIVAGDGHAQIGADLAKQVFPDLTDAQYTAIVQHMGTPTTPLGKVTKLADINNGRHSYSEYTQTKLNPVQSKFVRDVMQGHKWGMNKKIKPTGNKDFTEELKGKERFGYGAENDVYKDASNPDQILKIPGDRNGLVTPHSTPLRAIREGLYIIRPFNRLPYNLPLNIEGTMLTAEGKYVPVFSLRKVYVPLMDQPKIIDFDKSVNGMYSTAKPDINNILLENDIQRAKDFKLPNIGLLSDGTVMGIDLWRKGGKMNAIEQFKQGNKIHIKKENRGKFTKYCHGKVTDECIRKAKASGNPTLVKRATFAANARKWKHLEGGLLELLPIYGTYKDFERFKENPNWRTGASLGLSALGDIAMFTGAGAIVKGIAAANKAKKAYRVANSAANLARQKVWNAGSKLNRETLAVNSLTLMNAPTKTIMLRLALKNLAKQNYTEALNEDNKAFNALLEAGKNPNINFRGSKYIPLMITNPSFHAASTTIKKNGGLLKFEEGGKNGAPSTKFLSKLWFKKAGNTINNIGNNIGDFLKTDTGKGIMDIGLNILSGYTNYKKASNLLDSQVEQSKASLELTYLDTILLAVLNRAIQQLLIKELWKEAYLNGETLDNYSDIVASHMGYDLYSNSLQNAELQKKQQLALLDLYARNAKGSMMGNLFGSVVLNGLGALGGIIGNKGTSTNTSTNTSTPTLDFFNSPSIQTKNAMAAPSYNFNTGTFNTKTIGGNLNF